MLRCFFGFRQVFGFIGSRSRQSAVVVVLIGMAAVSGVGNLVSQWNILGEFENWPHEQVSAVSQGTRSKSCNFTILSSDQHWFELSLHEGAFCFTVTCKNVGLP